MPRPGVMAFSNLATGRLADGFGAGAVLALPGFAFIVVTVLSLCAAPLREIYGRRRTPWRGVLPCCYQTQRN